MVMRLIAAVISAYRLRVADHPIERPFLGTMGYLATFLVVRGATVIALLRGKGPHLELGGIHLHHMLLGLIAVEGVGLVSLNEGDRANRGPVGRSEALLFGSGSALLLDEFCLMLYVRDEYWNDRGVNISLLAVGLGGVALGANLLLGLRLYGSLAMSAADSVRGELAGLLDRK